MRFPSGPKRPGWAPLRALPVDRVGSYVRTLRPRRATHGASSAQAGADAEAGAIAATWLVALEGGSVVLRLRSCVEFCNRSAHALVLYLRVGPTTKQHAPIAAGASLWLPLSLAACTHFAVRPAARRTRAKAATEGGGGGGRERDRGSGGGRGRGPKWGNSPWLSLERSHTKVCPCPLADKVARAAGAPPTLLWLHLSVARRADGVVAISASAPLVLRNLLPLPVAFQLRTGQGGDVGCGTVQEMLAPGEERVVHEIPMEAPAARSAAGGAGGARAPSRMKVRLRIPGHRWSAFKAIRARDDDAALRDEAVVLRDDRWHVGVDSKYLRREVSFFYLPLQFTRIMLTI